MTRKAGWAQPVSRPGAQAPATPATPFAAAQTQLSAFPPLCSLRSPSARPSLELCPSQPPLSPAPGARRPSCTVEVGSALRSRPRRPHAVRAATVAAWRPRLWSPSRARTGDSSGRDAGPSACPLPPSAGAWRNSKALCGQKWAEDPPGSRSVSPRPGHWALLRACSPGIARTHRCQEQRQRRGSRPEPRGTSHAGLSPTQDD